MSREKIAAEPRRLERSTPGERLRQAARAVAGRLPYPALRERLRAACVDARRRPEAVLAAVVVGGVVVMVLHWS